MSTRADHRLAGTVASVWTFARGVLYLAAGLLDKVGVVKGTILDTRSYDIAQVVPLAVWGGAFAAAGLLMLCPAGLCRRLSPAEPCLVKRVGAVGAALLWLLTAVAIGMSFFWGGGWLACLVAAVLCVVVLLTAEAD